jgi:hypothetical protein
MEKKIIYWEKERDTIIEFIENFGDHSKRGIYLYGDIAIGKTTFIKTILNDYNILYLDGLEIRNKNKINDLHYNNLNTYSIMSSFNIEEKKTVIVLDDIDILNNIDKWGMIELIKLLKKKKKDINKINVPIICIGNLIMDKKIMELTKCMILMKLERPTYENYRDICLEWIPTVTSSEINNLLENAEYNLHRLALLIDIHINIGDINITNSSNNILCYKKATRYIINNKINISNYSNIIRDNDKTSVGLLFHENVVNVLKNDYNLYIEILKNFCFSDYVDRTIFQKQLWYLNEPSFLIKIINNNKILFENRKDDTKRVTDEDIKFTKILTKYSSEYSNVKFINKLCMKFNIDIDDLFLFSNILYNDYDDETKIEELYDIKALELKRIYKYLLLSKE